MGISACLSCGIRSPSLVLSCPHKPRGTGLTSFETIPNNLLNFLVYQLHFTSSLCLRKPIIKRQTLRGSKCRVLITQTYRCVLFLCLTRWDSKLRAVSGAKDSSKSQSSLVIIVPSRTFPLDEETKSLVPSTEGCKPC